MDRGRRWARRRHSARRVSSSHSRVATAPGLVRPHELALPLGIVLVPRANQAAASPGMSRATRRWRTSLRSRCRSSRSAALGEPAALAGAGRRGTGWCPLGHPVADRLLGRLDLTRELRDGTAGPMERDAFFTELRRARRQLQPPLHAAPSPTPLHLSTIARSATQPHCSSRFQRAGQATERRGDTPAHRNPYRQRARAVPGPARRHCVEGM